MKKKEDSKNTLIFISAGDNEKFATYAIDNLSENADIVIFFYGKEINNKFIEKSKHVFIGKGTKFNALKSIYETNPNIIKDYDYIWVCDDDIEIIKGSLKNMIEEMKRISSNISSPAHSRKGKISYSAMRAPLFGKKIRKTNFVEMTCPIFSKWLLIEFLNDYDSSLDGWGIDWWYMNTALRNNNSAYVHEAFIIRNPHDTEKANGREIDKAKSTPDRQKQWATAKTKNSLIEWEVKIIQKIKLPKKNSSQ